MNKKIVVLSTGGTIASTPGTDGRNVAGALAGEALLEKAELGADLILEVKSVFQKPSNAILLDDLAVLHAECQRLIERGDVSGIVITHGTDTLEDTAYFLESTLDTRGVGLVVTGSQRVPHAQGTDAYVNLRNAIQVAADEQAVGLGVLVVFNETIYSANFVRKVNSFQVNGFDVPGMGSLGLIDNGHITIFQRPSRQTLIAPVFPLPEVDILSVYLDARPALLEASVLSGARGIVLDALGRGHIPPNWMPALTQATSSGVAVAVCSSTLYGPVHQSYEFSGSLFDCEAAGALGLSGLSARKARLRLALLLGQNVTDPTEIRRAFSWLPGRS